MTLNVSLSEREISTDPVAALFRVSAVVSDHVTRRRQRYVNHDVDLGQGVAGRIVAIDYKNVTLRSQNGERRTVTLTPKRAALIAALPDPAAPAPAPAPSKRTSPRKTAGAPQAPHAGATTRK